MNWGEHVARAERGSPLIRSVQLHLDLSLTLSLIRVDDRRGYILCLEWVGQLNSIVCSNLGIHDGSQTRELYPEVLIKHASTLHILKVVFIIQCQARIER